MGNSHPVLLIDKTLSVEISAYQITVFIITTPILILQVLNSIFTPDYL